MSDVPHFPEPSYAKQPGESPKAYAAFALYRDMGAGRTIRTVATAIYGVQVKHSIRTVFGWSSKFNWVGRVGQYDAWLDMVAHGAVEDHERIRATDYAARREELRSRSFDNEERAASLESTFIARLEEAVRDLPVIRTTVEAEDAGGNPVVYRMYPATPNADLTIQRLHKIATRAEPTKVALTDPTGEHEHGRSPEELDKEFEEAFGTSDEVADADEE